MNASLQNPPRNNSSTLADSPWFWIVCFSAVGLLATTVIGPKYEQRQATLERKYQARGQVQRDIAAGRPLEQSAKSEDDLRVQYSTPGNTLVSLRPIRVVLIVILVVATAVLAWQRLSHRASTDTHAEDGTA